MGVKVTNERWAEIVAEAQPRTMLEPARLSTFRDLIARDDFPEGDLAELGVHDGGVCLLLKALCPSRNVWAFDTFFGMPEFAGPDEPVLLRGLYATDTEALAEMIRAEVLVIPGIFPRPVIEESHIGEVLRSAKFALAHLDADLYRSTCDGLEFFWPRLAPGGFVVLDDYGRPECPGVRRAVIERPELTPDTHHALKWDLNQLVLRKPLS